MNKKLVLITSKASGLEVSIGILEDWNGFDILSSHIQNTFEVKVTDAIDGPGARRWIFQSHEAVFELIFDDGYGNYLLAPTPQSEKIVLEIASDIGNRLSAFMSDKMHVSYQPDDTVEIILKAVEGWDGYNQLLNYLVNIHSAQIIFLADGEYDTKKCLLKHNNVPFELCYDILFGNYIRGTGTLAKSKVFEISRCIQNFLNEQQCIFVINP